MRLRFYELEWASLYRSAHTMYMFGFSLNSVLTLTRLAQLVQLAKLTQLVQDQFAKIILAIFSNFLAIDRNLATHSDIVVSSNLITSRPLKYYNVELTDWEKFFEQLYSDNYVEPY